MKSAISFPFAVVAALMFPHVKQEMLPESDAAQFEKALAKRQASKKELEKLLDRVKAGEKVSLETLFPKSEGSTGEQTLTALRQEVVTLQEEYENLNRESFAVVEESQEDKEVSKSEQEPKKHPLVVADRSRLGKALFQAGKYGEALAALQDAENPWSAFLAATCMERLGHAEEAVAAFEKVGEKFPESAAGKQAKSVSEFLKKRVKLGKTSDYDAKLAEIAAALLEDLPESERPAAGDK